METVPSFSNDRHPDALPPALHTAVVATAEQLTQINLVPGWAARSTGRGREVSIDDNQGNSLVVTTYNEQGNKEYADYLGTDEGVDTEGSLLKSFVEVSTIHNGVSAQVD